MSANTTPYTQWPATYEAPLELTTNATDDPLGIERPPSLARKAVEAALYITLFNSTFMFTTGSAFIPGLGGLLLLVAGGIGLTIQLAQGERLPISFWFAAAMTLAANVSQSLNGQPPIFGEGLRSFLFWSFQLLMVCYLIRNEATEKRMLVFMTLLVIAAVWMGGEFYGRKDNRLRLAQYSVGASFGNANQLATLSGLFAVSFLFWSLRALKSIRRAWMAPVLWILAATLVMILFRTASRSGVLLFACGMAMLAITILLGRGVRLAGIVVVGVVLVAASHLSLMLADSIEVLEYRAGLGSRRQDVYHIQTLYDMWDTALVGRGPSRAQVSAAGITAHNSFIYANVAFGGITAVILLAWVLTLGWRLLRMLVSSELPLDRRLFVATMAGMALGDMVFANQAYMHLSVLYAIGIIEKYTSAYSRRMIAQRRQAGEYAAFGGEGDLGWSDFGVSDPLSIRQVARW